MLVAAHRPLQVCVTAEGCWLWCCVQYQDRNGVCMGSVYLGSSITCIPFFGFCRIQTQSCGTKYFECGFQDFRLFILAITGTTTIRCLSPLHTVPFPCNIGLQRADNIAAITHWTGYHIPIGSYTAPYPACIIDCILQSQRDNSV